MSPYHTMNKTLNIQNKESREKDQETYKGRHITTAADFSMESIKSIRPWTDVGQTLRDHRCQPELL